MRELDGEEIVAHLRDMDKQILGVGMRGDSIFKQAADLIETLKCPTGEVKGLPCVVLFFPNLEEREKFIQLVKQENPNLKPKKL